MTFCCIWFYKIWCQVFFWNWFFKCLLENMIIFMWKIWYFTLFLPIMIRNKLKVWNFYVLVEIYQNNAIRITDKTVPWNIENKFSAQSDKSCYWSSLQIIWALFLHIWWVRISHSCEVNYVFQAFLKMIFQMEISF